MADSPYPRSRNVERLARVALGRKRLSNVLQRHIVAPMRTLEQKISDAGPTNQRIDPHLLTIARAQLEEAGRVLPRQRRGMAWYHLDDASPLQVEERLAELGPLHDRTSAQAFTMRVGQTLEIAVYRALTGQSLQFLGAFPDLDEHDDSTPYSKEEPPKFLSGKSMPGDMRLDFVVLHPTAGPVGIEAKNIREWLYPNRREIVDLLHKCCSVDAVPVLIARRISYSTFSILHATGVLVHQTFNQLYPASDAELASLVQQKHLLGYHDVRVGNLPDRRLTKFLQKDLPVLIPPARERFSAYKDLLWRYGRGEISYSEFAWRVRQREQGGEEDERPDEDWLPF